MQHELLNPNWKGKYLSPAPIVNISFKIQSGKNHILEFKKQNKNKNNQKPENSLSNMLVSCLIRRRA